jgi:cysteine dioxygenase
MDGAEALRNLLSLWNEARSPLAPHRIRRGIDGLRSRREDVADRINFSEVSYRRIIIDKAPHYVTLLLCWRSGQRSPIHDHAGSACGVRIIEGTATETRFARSPCGRLVPEASRCLGAGSVCVAHDDDIHQMGDLAPPGHDPITLHVYSPPLSVSRIDSIGETTLADHDGLSASRPQDLTMRIRLDGPHSGSSNTPGRVSEVMPWS